MKQFFVSQCCGAKAKWVGLLDIGDLYCTKCEKKCLVTLTKAGVDASVASSHSLSYPETTWEDQYPINTFSGRTKEELIGFIQAEILKAREDERRRITKLLLLVDDFDKLIREIKEENKI